MVSINTHYYIHLVTHVGGSDPRRVYCQENVYLQKYTVRGYKEDDDGTVDERGICRDTDVTQEHSETTEGKEENLLVVFLAPTVWNVSNRKSLFSQVGDPTTDF